MTNIAGRDISSCVFHMVESYNATVLNEKLLKSISEVRVPHDQKTPSLSIDQGFTVDIPNWDVFSKPIESEFDVNC